MPGHPARQVSILAQIPQSNRTNVSITLCASVRGKLVTLRIGRKGEMHEETYHIRSSTQSDEL
jgi:hypothetical protein